MNFGVYLTGAFGQSQALYDARNAAKRGRGFPEAVERQILEDTKTVIEKQKEAGLSFVIDSMLRMYHLLQPFSENVPGVKIGPQENWFNNNVFFWRPEISGKIDASATGFTVKYLHTDLLLQGGDATVVLPSPYTLIALSTFKGVNGYEMHPAEQRSKIIDIANLIKAEAQNLVKKGFKRIQYDEPAIVNRQSLGSLTRTDISLLASAMRQCGRISGATTILHTYFGDAGPIMEQLRDLETDGIGIDCTETRLDDVSKHKFTGKELVLGLVNARTTARENPESLAKKVRMVAEATDPKALWLTPNTGTEYIGWAHGLEKLAVLKAAKEHFEK